MLEGRGVGINPSLLARQLGAAGVMRAGLGITASGADIAETLELPPVPTPSWHLLAAGESHASVRLAEILQMPWRRRIMSQTWLSEDLFMCGTPRGWGNAPAPGMTDGGPGAP